jgi:uncharacterized protein YjbI with pentapeptide repeats
VRAKWLHDPGPAGLWRIQYALAACFAAAVAVLAGLLVATWILLHHPSLPHSHVISVHDSVGVAQLVFATVAGAGALVALVVAYRRQRVAEVATRVDKEHWEATAAHDQYRVFNERFTAIAAQLGHSEPAVRLAGVHAMAGLADDWTDNRQTCVDVLCAYLRLPPGNPSERVAYEANREVRHTIIRLICTHLREGAAWSWEGLNFDFTGVMFDGGNFADARFSGGIVRFDGASFRGGRVSFDRAKFSGSQVSFDGANFSGARVSFDGAEFSRGGVDFEGAEFYGGVVSFQYATFSGSRVSFIGASFSGCLVIFDASFDVFGVYFNDARFSGGAVIFDGAFLGGGMGFGGAEFSGGQVYFKAGFSGTSFSFGGVVFSGGLVIFDEAQFMGGQVRFGYDASAGGGDRMDGAVFSDGQISFTGARFAGSQVSFGGAKFSGSQVSFDEAYFSGGQVSFGHDLAEGEDRFTGAVFSGGRVSFTGATFSGSQVSFDGAKFSGGEVDFSHPRDWSHPPQFGWKKPPAGVTLPAGAQIDPHVASPE